MSYINGNNIGNMLTAYLMDHGIIIKYDVSISYVGKYCNILVT